MDCAFELCRHFCRYLCRLSIALAEVLDGIPIFARRVRLKMGVSIAVLAVAVGKIAGSLYYFINGFFEGI